MMPEKLSPQDRTQLLGELEKWRDVEGRDAITRTFSFDDFNQAFGFMTQVAMLAEKMDHHPEWFNVYNKVEVVLTTHDAHGVSDLDAAMARAMERFAGG